VNVPLFYALVSYYLAPDDKSGYKEALLGALITLSINALVWNAFEFANMKKNQIHSLLFFPFLPLYGLYRLLNAFFGWSNLLISGFPQFVCMIFVCSLAKDEIKAKSSSADYNGALSAKNAIGFVILAACGIFMLCMWYWIMKYNVDDKWKVVYTG
jgi:hypothetical protein